ncbi:hypothetical protein [Legionella worsleiensis]|uniref:Uncharacterized protein n=1 Tax=Legionella worsleiensis TaxID=45076 RepID=A0A0W1AAM9_9GAMM|nr:hypothetical protein [Legionella worsleiensis]KTD78208.1 hypothetical protein Lwor_1603 [Legionella worsleiensis]STY32545.1 Uncharacterised protein [Legionella worsleiensis]
MLIDDTLYMRISSNDPTLTELNLSGKWQGIETDKLSKIAEALKYNHTITSINFDNVPLYDAGLAILMNALSNNQTIQVLSLKQIGMNSSYARSRGEGQEKLIEFLKKSTSIREIHLSNNHSPTSRNKIIPGLFAEALEHNSSLVTLSLENIDISWSGIDDHVFDTILTRLNINRKALNIEPITSLSLESPRPIQTEVYSDNELPVMVSDSDDEFDDALSTDTTPSAKPAPTPHTYTSTYQRHGLFGGFVATLVEGLFQAVANDIQNNM